MSVLQRKLAGRRTDRTLNKLMAEFVALYQAGESPPILEFIERAGGDGEELAGLLSLYMQLHPPPMPSTAALERAMEDLGYEGFNPDIAAEIVQEQHAKEPRHARREVAGPSERSRARRRPVLAASGRPILGGVVALVIALAVGLTFLPSGSEVAAVCHDSSIPGAGSGRLEGQQITVAAVWTDNSREQRNFRKVLQLFEKRTGAELSFHSAGHDIADVIEERIESGCDPPDVVILPQPGLLRQLVHKLEPVGETAGRLVKANYTQRWRDLGTVDGDLYGVWFKAASKSIIWYNAELFRQAGVSKPKTGGELKRVAAELTRSNITPFSVAGGSGWTLTDWFENVYLRTAGPDRYNQLSDREIPWTDESVKRALRWLAEIFGRKDWLAGGTRGALHTDFPASVKNVFSDRPRAAMVYEGDFVASEIDEAKLGKSAKFFDFPAIDQHQPGLGVTGATGGDVAALVKGSNAGRHLVEFLATPEAALPWAGAGGFLSPNKRLDLASYRDARTRRLAEAVTGGEGVFDLSDLQRPAFGASKHQGMWPILQDYLRNPANPDGTAERLEAAAKQAEE